MITKRTDSNGANLKDSRLKLLKKCLEHVDVNGIYQLNDHKGILTVVWEDKPTKNNISKVQSFWTAFCEDEIQNETKTTKQIYHDLYWYLKNKYPKSVELIDDEIHVDMSANLFNYVAQEFSDRQMEDEKLYKIVKKYSDNFYCEWQDSYSQVIQINL